MSKTIDIQGHKFIAALIDYFEKERDNVGPLLLVNTVRERVAAGLNITVSTVNNIAYKMKNNTLDSAEKTRLHTKWVTNLDHLDIGFIRDQIYEIYKNSKYTNSFIDINII
ncbi:hypothetical protein GWI33_022864 [Rhynchophorus ferrugineus]|uniref:Uncharacterized protein n=1 Tax=Rhynchophorus ferrugineus TaxID=354439 RepID=A0A834IMJ5_RHYFE|nr:hypothetical protein GWI33_022864 [Rhynchophorus ferrugineus]